MPSRGSTNQVNGAPAGPLNNIADIFGNRQFHARRNLLAIDEPDLGETIKKKLGANKFDEIANKNALPNAIAVAELLDDMAGRKKDDAGNDLYDLSAREQEILAFVAKGHSDSEIADTLFISIRTVQAHLRSIYSKLGVKNRTAAVHLAQEKKLL